MWVFFKVIKILHYNMLLYYSFVSLCRISCHYIFETDNMLQTQKLD